MSLQLPPTYLLSTHLAPDDLHALEDQIPSLTWNIHEAELVLGKISRRERALFELRRLNLRTEELPSEPPGKDDGAEEGDGEPSRKRRRISPDRGDVPLDDSHSTGGAVVSSSSETVRVLKLSWFEDSLAAGALLPENDYLLYTGKKLPPATADTSSQKHVRVGPGTPTKIVRSSSLGQAAHRASPAQPPPKLVRETTSEHSTPLPPVPDFLQTTYSCQRPTPVNPPNGDFVEELKAVRTLRILQGDQVGVRAYSSSIASLAAYPFALQTPGVSREVARLPGCGAKIAELYGQWREDGELEEKRLAAADERLSVLKLFYDIWGVGDTTARDFYKKGWRSLDDIVEHGWDQLSRVQQIGVKYYDEFRRKIPRDEVEAIGATILAHARKIHPGFQLTIVGGYRRGKTQSGDVDVVISHPDAAMTLGFVERIVRSLERTAHVTHTLTLSLRNSERDQAPLPWRGEGAGARKGSGFDTLDKALVVWRDPHGDAAAAAAATSSAPHRRVDIIVSPWKTVGCAVLGWSGGTTFQRDLRRYCKQEKGLKFDSSGIRSRADGAWVDLEGSGGASPTAAAVPPAPDMETAERRVFEALGLVWRRPEERCTG